MVARYVVPEINGYVRKLARVADILIENRQCSRRRGSARDGQDHGKRIGMPHPCRDRPPDGGGVPTINDAGTAKAARQAERRRAATFSQMLRLADLDGFTSPGVTDLCGQ